MGLGVVGGEWPRGSGVVGGEWPSGPVSSICLTEVKHVCARSETGWATSK